MTGKVWNVLTQRWVSRKRIEAKWPVSEETAKRMEVYRLNPQRVEHRREWLMQLVKSEGRTRRKAGETGPLKIEVPM